jgi:hypothetical protein
MLVSKDQMNGSATSSHRAQYEGKNLQRLLIAVCVPPALLFLRLVCGMVASDGRFPAAQRGVLGAAAIAFLALFVAAELWAAYDLQRLLPARGNLIWRILQYVLLLVFCLAMSLIGATILEAFGYNLLVRAGGLR